MLGAGIRAGLGARDGATHTKCVYFVQPRADGCMYIDSDLVDGSVRRGCKASCSGVVAGMEGGMWWEKQRCLCWWARDCGEARAVHCCAVLCCPVLVLCWAGQGRAGQGRAGQGMAEH